MANSVNKRINIYINGKEVENNIKSVRAAMQKLINEQSKMTIGSDEYVEHSKKIRQLRTIYENHRQELKSTSAELDKLKNKTTNIVDVASATTIVTNASNALNRITTTISKYVDSYAELDDALAAVRKTTGMTAEEVQSLHESLTKVDTRTATNELLAIAEQGGRLGLAKEEIESFTIAVDKANVALGDSFSGGAQEIATVLGKIRNAYKEVNTGDVGDAFNKIGSVINELGASSAASEGNIANFTQRVGAMPNVFKPSVQEAMALGAAFEENSVDAEIASRAYGILFKTAAADIDKFAAAMGEPAEAMRELINTNPTDFALRFAESLRGLNATETAEYLKNLGLNADGVSKALGALSNNTDRVRELIELSNTAFKEGTSLQNEFNVVNENTAAQMEKARKAVTDASAALGETLAPVLVSITNGTASFLQAINALAKTLTEHKGLVASLVSAWTAYIVISNKTLIVEKAKAAQLAITTAATNTARTAALLMATAQATLSKNTTRAAAAQKLLKAAFASTPWGAILTAVTALATGIVHLVSKSKQAKKEQDDLSDSMVEFGVAAEKETSSAKELFNKLEKLTKGSKEYNEVQAQILETYPELLARQVDEKGNLLDLADAYKEVTRSIQDKWARQMMAEDVTKIGNEYLKKELEFINELPAALRAEAKSVIEESAALRDQNFDKLSLGDQLFVQSKIHENFINNLGEDFFDSFSEEIWGAFNAYIDYIEKKKEIESQYSVFLKSEEEKREEESALAAAKQQQQQQQQRQQAATDDQKEWKKYQQKVANFRENNRVNQLSDWEKTKTQIIKQYDELINEASKYGARGKAIAAQLETEKGEAILEAGQKYLADYGEFLTKFQEETTQLAESGQLTDEQSKLVNEILGSNKEWDQKIDAIQERIDHLRTLLADITPNDANYNSFNAMLTELEQQLGVTLEQKVTAAANVVEKYVREGYDFVKQEQNDLTQSTLTEYERQIAAIDERYDAEIQKVRELIAAKQALLANGGNTAQTESEVAELLGLIDTMEGLREEQKSNVKKGTSGSDNQWERLIEIMKMTPQEFANNWVSALQTVNSCLQEFASSAISIYSSINEIQSNKEDAELDSFTEMQDAKLEALENYYNQGAISEKFYNAQKEKLEEEQEEKENQINHAQFEREKKASIAEATIQGTLAAVTSFAKLGYPLGLITMSLSLATTAAQIAAIASQANPYAKGGWIKQKQLILAGEAGQEWVASNKLVEDNRTRPVINALDEYQRGNKTAFEALRVSVPDGQSLSKSANVISRNFADTKSVINNYYSKPTEGNTELLKEMRRMNRYLSDPKNRQAYITRKQQLEFDKQETEIKKYARL